MGYLVNNNVCVHHNDVEVNGFNLLLEKEIHIILEDLILQSSKKNSRLESYKTSLNLK